MFSISIHLFESMFSKHSNEYKPTCVIKQPNGSYDIVTAIDFKFNKSGFYIIVEENFTEKSRLNFNDNTYVSFNLSSIPSNILNIFNSLSERNIPSKESLLSLDSNSNDVKFKNPPLSFILKNLGDVKMEDGIATVTVSTCNINAYQQWSVNSVFSSESRDNSVFPSDFVNKVNEYNKKNSSNLFTPTTTLYIGENTTPIIGVVESMNIVTNIDLNTVSKSNHTTQGKFNKFMTEQSYSSVSHSTDSKHTTIELIVNTNSIHGLKDKLDLSNETYTGVPIYMNIDDTVESDAVDLNIITVQM